MNPRYFIVLSAEHAEELFPNAPDGALIVLHDRIEKFGAAVVEVDRGSIRPLIAENGRQIANRLRGAAHGQPA